MREQGSQLERGMVKLINQKEDTFKKAEFNDIAQDIWVNKRVWR
jgi:hypothetical protein